MNWDKQKILTFLCAIWPGAGYMFFGMMKKGAIVMAIFTALTGLTMTIGWKFLAFLLPVLWFYSFFDTFRIARLSEECREEEDQIFFEKAVAFCKDDPLKNFEGRKTLLAVVILLTSLYTLIYGVLLPFFRWGEQFYWVQVLLTVIPTAVVAILLFLVGKDILQKEQERKEAEELAEEMEEEAMDAEDAEAVLVEEAEFAEGNVEELVEAALEEMEAAEEQTDAAMEETEAAAEVEEPQAADSEEEIEKEHIA
ncbi:MAG: hypothetical protein Q4C06_04825 [Bacillota bacterium]|nr:hypothetical protein [Bacillota bacterium]